jgi:hypothetical protein
MNPTAIYSKSGKGVQEAAGKTSLLQRADRAVLAAIDGRANLNEVAQKVGKSFDPAFQTLIGKLDKDGFIREVSAGAAVASPVKPAAMPPKPAAKPAGGGDFGDLDFSSLGGGSKPASPPSRPAAPPAPPSRPAAAPPSRPAAPPAPPPAAAKAQTDALAKAREEAEAKAQAERERIRAEAEAKTRAEMEAKMRDEAEKKMKFEAAAKADAAAKAAAAEAEAKIKAARDAALKAAEAKLKAEADAKAKIEAERKAREETERRLEEERKAREAAERKAKEEAERARKEAEEKARREAEELRQRLEEERKAREAAERKAKEEAERVRRELEEERKRLEAERKREEEERAERKKREEEEAEARRKQREEEERKADEEREAKRKRREEEDRRAEEERAAKRKQREEEDSGAEAQRQAEREAKRKREEEQAAALLAVAEGRKAQPKKPESFGDSLLADLDSFSNRDEEERKAKEEEERKAKAAAEQRRREQAERQAKEEAERQRREEEEERRKVEEARRAREEEEQRAQEEERRRREMEEIRRKAAAATAAAIAKEGKGEARSDDDIPISDDDLEMDEVKKEQAALAKTQAKEREKDKERERAAAKAERKAESDSARIRKPIKWGKLVTNTLILLVVAGLIAVHVMPVGVADYERSATEAIGRPVKIGEGKFWLLTGPQIRFSNVRVGDARIAQVAASVSPGSLFSDRKEFTRVEIDGLSLPQEALAEVLFATVKSESLAIDRIVIKSLELPGPAVMPKGLQADAQLDGKGALRSATVHGPDGLVARIVPKEGSVEFDVIAAGFTLPIAPEITLSKFAMKGSANPRGMKVDEWGGAIFNGGISGTASIRWGGTWSVEGVVTVRGINAAVFAPALISNGTGEGTGRFTMTGSDPAKLASSGRLEGNFTVTQGTLGSYDLAKGIQSSGKAAAGTTPFTEMTGQAVYDRGAVALRNVSIGAGALNAAASADIAQSGALSGRIVADVKSSSRSQQATIVLGGTVKEPQVRN